MKGEEVGIRKSLKAHAGLDSAFADGEDVPDFASEISRPLSQRGKSLDFSPRGSRDVDEDRAGKIGYTNQFTAQQIYEASLRDGRRAPESRRSELADRKWVLQNKSRSATKETINSFIGEDLEDEDDDELCVARGEVDQKFQTILRNHRPLKDKKRSASSRKSSSISTSSQSRSGSTLRDATLSSLMKGGSVRTSAPSPRDRATSSGSSVRSRRNNTFNPMQAPADTDSPHTSARMALERRALEGLRDQLTQELGHVDKRSNQAQRMSTM